MRKRFIIISSLVLLSSIAIHLYLSSQSYAMKVDQFNSSNLCEIGKWSCNEALTSSFAEIFGWPISIFGVALNLFCLVILWLIHFRWLSPLNTWSRWIWRIALFLALGSIVMFFISLVFLSSFCPACTLLYALSFVVLWPLYQTLPSKKIFHLSFRNTSKESWMISVYVVVFILAAALLVHAFMVETYPIKKAESSSQAHFVDWISETPVAMPSPIEFLVEQGPLKNQALFTVTEFIDFLCVHCQKSHEAFKIFHKTHPDVRIEYISYPLNPRGCHTDFKDQKISPQCLLAQGVFCAEDKKYQIQDFIFTNQEKISRMSVEKIRKTLEEKWLSWNQDVSKFRQCLESSEARNGIEKQIEIARKLDIRGTPTLFVGNKKIPADSINLTLQKIYQFYLDQNQSSK